MEGCITELNLSFLSYVTKCIYVNFGLCRTNEKDKKCLQYESLKGRHLYTSIVLYMYFVIICVLLKNH
jgi:hypothetical protein